MYSVVESPSSPHMMTEKRYDIKSDFHKIITSGASRVSFGGGFSFFVQEVHVTLKSMAVKGSQDFREAGETTETRHIKSGRRIESHEVVIKIEPWGKKGGRKRGC